MITAAMLFALTVEVRTIHIHNSILQEIKSYYITTNIEKHEGYTLFRYKGRTLYVDYHYYKNRGVVISSISVGLVGKAKKEHDVGGPLPAIYYGYSDSIVKDARGKWVTDWIPEYYNQLNNDDKSRILFLAKYYSYKNFIEWIQNL